MNLGYACINTVLSKNKIMTNRTMRRKTFDAQGIDYVSELALLNVKDLKTIVQWNNEMGIKLFRLSSQIFLPPTIKLIFMLVVLMAIKKLRWHVLWRILGY